MKCGILILIIILLVLLFRVEIWFIKVRFRGIYLVFIYLFGKNLFIR